MSNPFDETRAAVQAAESQIRAVDGIASSMAALLRGRLRLVPRWVLVDLKKEISDFNAKNKEWKK